MSGVLIGGRNATLEALQAIPVPEATATYVTVSHFDLAARIRTIACDMFRAMPMSEGYQLARNGNQLFGVMTFSGENGNGLSVGLRNSYDVDVYRLSGRRLGGPDRPRGPAASYRIPGNHGFDRFNCVSMAINNWF